MSVARVMRVSLPLQHKGLLLIYLSSSKSFLKHLDVAVLDERRAEPLSNDVNDTFTVSASIMNQHPSIFWE